MANAVRRTLWGVVMAVVAAGSTIAGATVARAAPVATPAVTPWRAAPAPAPVVPNGRLIGVSCSDADRCVAVGSFRNRAGVQRAIAMRWDGTSWEPEAVPGGTAASELLGVSCLGDGSCVAVGRSGDGALVVRSDGTSWVRQNAAAPLTATASLTAVSCAGATSCLAVGTRPTGAAVVQAWDGFTWHDQPIVVTNASFPQLTGVSCAAAGACTVVGTVLCYAACRLAMLVGNWDGTTVTATAIGNDASATNLSVTSVSCWAAGACVAVGWLSRCDIEDPFCTQLAAFALYETDGRWTRAGIPAPGGATSFRAAAVSCPVAAHCVATGRLDGAARTPSHDDVALTWNGQGWRSTPLPTPASRSTFAQVGAISCVATGGCEAVGGVDRATEQGRMEVYGSADGRRWRRDPIRELLGTADIFSGTGVSCVSATSCVSIGTVATTGFAARWDGAGWTTTVLPTIATDRLAGVSCGGTGGCVAVGSWNAPGGTTSPLAAVSDDGTTWRLDRLTPPLPEAALTSVSCVGATCTAVGTARTCTEPSCLDQPFVARLAGSSWTTTTLVPPSDHDSGRLAAVSCTTATTCVAVGTAVLGPLVNGPPTAYVVRTVDGTQWVREPVALPPNGPLPDLTAVSCSGATFCVAAGADQTKRGRVLDAQVWDGTGWTPQRISGTYGSQTRVGGVSCGAPGRCSLVAAPRTPDPDPGVGFDLRSGGWHRDPPAGGAALTAVSCPAPEVCLAVGGGAVQVRGT